MEKYSVLTEKVSFTLKVLQDPSSKDFIAQISGHTPPLVPRVEPGQAFPEMRLIDSEGVRDADKEKLLELCKRKMVRLGGDISHFFLES